MKEFITAANNVEVAEPRIKVNLQLFAEGDPDPVPAADPVTDPQPGDSGDPQPANTNVQEPQPGTADQVNQSDVTQTQSFAKRLKEEVQRSKDALIAEIYGQQGITSYDAYRQALERQRAEEEAQKLGVDPSFYQEFSSMKDKLGAIEREKTLIEQDRTLESDQKYGELYKMWRDDVKRNSEQYGVDYNTAFTVMCREKLPDLLTSYTQRGEQDAIKKITQNATTSPGALGDGADNQKVNVNEMSEKDFNAMLDRVKRGEKITL